MKTLEQKLTMTGREVKIRFADTGYVITLEGTDGRGTYTNWCGVVTSLPEVFTILERVNAMEKSE
jgi:hypothetical protein